MPTLFNHTIEALNENMSMNGLEHWFDGFDSAADAMATYQDSFTGETSEEEMEATVDALEIMFNYDVDDIEHAHAQAAIEEWNMAVWGQDFAHNGYSVPFSG